MSGKFTGVTFAKQKVTPSDDAIVRRAILPDGILAGCELSYSGSTLTMAAGHLMICGRQIRMPSVQNWAVVDATSGFARLVLTIDLTRTATKDSFDQVVDSIEYASAEDGFVSLDQTDINLSGNRYQVSVCVVSLGAGGITGIVSQLEKSAVDGSGALNFKVVGGLTQPAGPKENTIWVNTDQKITSWIFSANAPAEPAEGAIWFKVGTSGRVIFDALKKNSLLVYPDFAKQFISGAWVDKPVEIYQDGEWADWWNGELYAYGETYDHITGGFKVYKAANGVVEWNEKNVYLGYTGSSDRYASISTEEAVDMTGYSRLRVRVSQMTHSSNYFLRIGIMREPYTGISSEEFDAACIARVTSSANVSEGSTKDIELDLTSIAEGKEKLYVQIAVYVSKVYIDEIILIA